MALNEIEFDALLDCLERGRPISGIIPRPIRISDSELRDLIFGLRRNPVAPRPTNKLLDLFGRRGPPADDGRQPPNMSFGPLVIEGTAAEEIFIYTDGNAATTKRPDHKAIFKCDIGIHDRHQVIDLSKLTGDGGAGVRPLVLRKCTIEGLLDLSDSHFVSIEISNCEMRGIRGVGLRVASQFLIDRVRALESKDQTPENKKENTKDAYCQVHLVSAVLGGALDLRGSRLRSPEVVLPDDEPLPSGRYADQFALALSMCTIGGRLIMNNGFEARGGVSLFQARIGGSVTIEGCRLLAHKAHEPPTLIKGDNCRPDRHRRRRNYAALDAGELSVDGTFRWIGTSALDDDRSLNICGRVILMRARIKGDLYFRDCRWGAESMTKRRLANGGIDARYIRIDGQLRIDGHSYIARRHRVSTGLRTFNSVGPAIDLWKSTIGLGIRVEHDVILHGAILANESVIGRQIFIACRIDIQAKTKPLNSPYHLAVDFGEARLDGDLLIHTPQVGGRVSLTRMAIGGSVEIQKLGFDYRWTAEPRYDLELLERRGADQATAADTNPDRAVITPSIAAEYDETSIFDMQDLSVVGGINIKRGAVSIAQLTRPHNGFIVDQRGMKADTWDDADATCWQGLLETDPKRLVPWRLRMDGIMFNRLDSSGQANGLARSAANFAVPPAVPWEWGQLLHYRIGKLYRSDRSFMTLGNREVRQFRLATLTSFHGNRAKSQRSRSKLKSWLDRWTFQPSWHRRETIPAFTPQPFEAFARAYMQRGDIDTAIWIARRRLELQWRRRSRAISQRGAILYIPAVLLGVFLAWTWYGSASGLLQGWTIIPSALFAVSIAPVLAIMTIWSFWLFFGFGLGSKQAAITLILFIVFTGFGTPYLVDRDCLQNSRQLNGHVAARSFYYGIDKLIPVDLKAQIYPIVPDLKKQYPAQVSDDAEKAPASKTSHSTAVTCRATSSDTGADSTGVSSLSAYNNPPGTMGAYKFYEIIDHIFDVLGWVVLSLALITFSGLLRRDLDR